MGGPDRALEHNVIRDGRPGPSHRPERYSALATSQGSSDIHSSSGAKRNTNPPFAICGMSFLARVSSSAGHPSLCPALLGVTYGAPWTTTPRSSARSLNSPDTPLRRRPMELYFCPADLPLNA